MRDQEGSAAGSRQITVGSFLRASERATGKHQDARGSQGSPHQRYIDKKSVQTAQECCWPMVHSSDHYLLYTVFAQAMSVHLTRYLKGSITGIQMQSCPKIK